MKKHPKSKSIHAVSLILKLQRVIADVKVLVASIDGIAHEICEANEHGIHGFKNEKKEYKHKPFQH